MQDRIDLQTGKIECAVRPVHHFRYALWSRRLSPYLPACSMPQRNVASKQSTSHDMLSEVCMLMLLLAASVQATDTYMYGIHPEEAMLILKHGLLMSL